MVIAYPAAMAGASATRTKADVRATSNVSRVSTAARGGSEALKECTKPGPLMRDTLELRCDGREPGLLVIRQVGDEWVHCV